MSPLITPVTPVLARERERENGAKPALAGLYSQPRPGILVEGRMADAREGPQSFIDDTRVNTKM